MKTLASSASSQGLEKLINEYFYSIDYVLKDDGRIWNRRLNVELFGFGWSKKGKRYYFKQDQTTTREQTT